MSPTEEGEPARASASGVQGEALVEHRDPARAPRASALDRFTGPARGHVAVRWLFLRALGLVYLAAFVSLWSQIDGLIGSQGISPASQLVAAARAELGSDGWKQLLTVFWWDASDAAIHRLFAAGTVLSLLLVFGVAPVPVLIGLFVLYHSVLVVGGPFLNFQWDTLLLETGFLAILYAPLGALPRPSREAGPPVPFAFLMRWLLFRLMFSSGAVKLLTGDVNWANLTAMEYHYMTQPLPPWTAWYCHHLPVWAHQLETLATFVLELGVPFLVFGHRAARGAAFAGFAMLSCVILVTGNYGFFNWLTLALALTVLDDGLLPARLRAAIVGAPTGAPARPRWWTRVPAVAAAALVLALTTTHLLRTIDLAPRKWPVPVAHVLEPVWNRVLELDRRLAPANLFSQYGLFRVMTVERPEVVIEGSRDGVDWRAYEFRWKMGDPERRPAFVAPHMPRLDWQMWFAALGGVGRQRWFVELMSRLLTGSKPVLALLAANPFPDAPPKYVRATLYDYRFTTPQERKVTGAWWKRTLTRAFFPQASLRE